MATNILSIQDYMGYVKCGEILKSPLENYQNQFILKCYQCSNVYFILESFIIHMQEHYRDDLMPKEKIQTKAETEASKENIENPSIKLEDCLMEVEDPLIVIKNESYEDEYFQEDKEIKNNVTEQHDDLEEFLTNSGEEYHTDDFGTEEDERIVKSTKKQKNILPPTINTFIKSKNNMKTLIEIYKNQPNLWNKNLPLYRIKDKRQQCLEELRKDVNNNLNLKLTLEEVSKILSHICQKHREDCKRLQYYERNDKDKSDKKYKCCWYFEDLHFLRPKEIIELEKLDGNLPDLTPNQVIQILEIYREFPQLWNTNLIEYICSNKRHEAQIEMMKKIETNMNLRISEQNLVEYLRTVHNYFSREKRLKVNNINIKDNNKLKNITEDYYDHLQYLNDHEGPFNCPECNRVYSKPLGFKVHKSRHNGLIPLICSLCNKEFKTIPSYTTHAKRHMEDLEFVCKECNRKFINYQDLKVHLLTHTKDRPYCCEICGAAYRHVQCFKRHQRRHEKRFSHTCHICSKGYYSKDRYDDHMNSHMNIRSHICKLCGKGFITSRALKTHAVTHEDVRNHACKLCGKTFKLKIGVLQHMRTHGSKFEIEDKN